MELEGRVAIVTGAARGLGRGIALALAREGVNVIVADVGDLPSEHLKRHRLSGLDEQNRVVEEVKKLGVKSLPVKVDLTKTKDIEEMVDRTIKEFGTIDILVNNAGITWMTPILELEEKVWDAVFAVNAKAVFLCCKEVAPHMIKKKWGRIVNIASIGGKEGWPLTAAYAASKAANRLFTKVAAMELAPYNITANTVNPGAFEGGGIYAAVKPEHALLFLGMEKPEDFTEIVKQRIPLGRLQRIEDIADAVVFLCKSENITAQEITVAGGMFQA